MNAPRPEPALRDLEPPALAEQNILSRHADILEHDLGMAMRRIVDSRTPGSGA